MVTDTFTKLAKVLKGLAAVYSVRFDSSFIESDIKKDIECIRDEFKTSNGKKYGFACTIGIRENGTNNSLGTLFRSYLDDGDFRLFYNIVYAGGLWYIDKVDESEIYF